MNESQSERGPCKPGHCQSSVDNGDGDCYEGTEAGFCRMQHFPKRASTGRQPEAPTDEQAERDSIALWSIFWSRKRKTFTTTRQASLASWRAALASTEAPAEPKEQA